MQPHDERSIEDLLAEADAGRERGTLGATLDAINRSVHDVAVSVTVNLHGKLIGLELTEHAMALPPGELAARISAATTEAAAAALADGMQVLTDSFGGWIGDAIGDQIGVVE